jgi:hypothetical protein
MALQEDWFKTLDRAKALGREYADNGIAGGERAPQEAPLSGEWAGSITPKDIVTELAGGDPEVFKYLQDWEVTDILDHWEDGYNSAEWPERPSDED